MNFSDFNMLHINGHALVGWEVVDFCRSHEMENIRLIGLFIEEWLSEDPYMEVRTSGSTGGPKTLTVRKEQMLRSAEMTAKYFDFKDGQRALLCLPANYIAGKMMVVRALYSRLKLYCVAPNSNPTEDIPEGMEIDFAPLVPMQLKKDSQVSNFQKILLGGAPINPHMEKWLALLDVEVYHSYGMTETLSHVAIRRVDGTSKSNIYRALPEIRCETDERSCLILRVPFLEQPLTTNDVVQLISPTEFIWKGRYDNVVNSGGLKVYVEEIEQKLASHIQERFFIAGIPDEQLGEKLFLFIEDENVRQEKYLKLKYKLQVYIENKYEIPREIVYLKSFITTTSGKINREATIQTLEDRDEYIG